MAGLMTVSVGAITGYRLPQGHPMKRHLFYRLPETLF
jgi:hypothetical protein